MFFILLLMRGTVEEHIQYKHLLRYKSVVSDYLLLTLCAVAYLRPQRTNQQIKTITHMIKVIYSSI